MSWVARMSVHMQELRVVICPVGEGSAGLREYLQNNYDWIKTLNPRLPIPIRSGETAKALITCRYDYNVTNTVDVDFLSAKEIEETIKNFVNNGKNKKKSEESDWKEPKIVYAKQRGRLVF